MAVSVKGTEVETRDGGGTAAMLPAERARASFSVAELSRLLNGDDETQAQRAQWVKLFDTPEFDFRYDVHDDRGEAFKKSVGRTISAIKVLKSNPDLKSTHMNAMLGLGGPGFTVGNVAQSGSSAAGNHYGIFVGAILARASPEQQSEWLSRALNGKIFGAYGQTELSHGSNVRALQTTATFDEETQEFVIHSPTLGSTKWWPGCFGVMASHAVIYARLILKGRDVGVHEFMVQLRDADGTPMPGVEVFEIGPKMGYNLVDNGGARFDHVRVPRFNMLAGHAEVTPDGRLVAKGKKAKKKKPAGKPAIGGAGGAGGAGKAAVKKAESKLKYIVMIQTRVSMVHGAFKILAASSTIAIRYSAVRRQGFKNTRERSLESGEHAVLEYQVQQYRLFKALSAAYAYAFTAKSILQQLHAFRKQMASGDVSALPTLHATAAGLKSFCTNLAGDMIEDVRRCCGGHGSLLNSGIAKLVCDFNTISPIAEGDAIVLALQTARFLVRALQGARSGASTPEGDVAYLQRGSLAAPTFAPASLRDLAALEEAFAWRARASVVAATDSFEADEKRGLAFDVAWNANAVALVTAARHHCQAVILSRFAQAVRDAKDAAVRAVLDRLAVHYALVEISEHGVDWAGCLDADAAARIRAEIKALLAAIRPDAVSLVDAFGFTDKQLSSSLGRADGNVYEALYDYAVKSPLNKPEYVKSLWRDVLSRSIDREFLEKGKREQRAGAGPAKL